MSVFIRPRRAALIGAACLALAGCTQQDADCLARLGRKLTERAQSAADSVRGQLDGDLKALPQGANAPTEISLKERIETRMRWDALLAGLPIEVRVNGGEVELKGTVKNDAQRRRAGDLAESTTGVQIVNDTLQVEE